MMPLWGVKPSTSSPPATKPVVMVTVAPEILVLSTSVTVTVASITVAPSPSVKASVAPAVTAGASLMVNTSTVEVATLLSAVAAEPSSTWNEMVREAPSGSSPVF